jgi:hypothetical protein
METETETNSRYRHAFGADFGVMMIVILRIALLSFIDVGAHFAILCLAPALSCCYKPTCLWGAR